MILAGLVIPPFWPCVLLMIAAQSRPMRRLRATLQARLQGLWAALQIVGSPLMRRLAALVVTVLALIGASGLWLYSHLDPGAVGTCHKVALYMGKTPTVDDCEPLAVGDFGVLLGLGAILVLLISGEPITTPFGTYRRRIEDAGQVLKEEGTPDDLERIARTAFMDLLSRPPGPPPTPPST